MFNSDGYLDPGIHKMSLTEFSSAFVTAFPFSNTRKDIFVGYLEHFSDLAKLVSSFEQIIDGSFTTNKNDPNDVDLVVLVDAAMIDMLSTDQQATFSDLVSGKNTQLKYKCDAYFCPTYPDTHPNYQDGRTQRKYWLGEFGYDRQDTAKGIVEISYPDGV